MASKRVASGSPLSGEQKSQQNILTDVVTFTGSTIVTVAGRGIKRKGGAIDVVPFHVLSLNFQDAGGVATVHRLAAVNNNDGTFTINASKESGVAGVYATATNPCTVRWTVLAI